MRSLQTTRKAVFRAVLLAGGASVIAVAQPALAQDATEGTEAEAAPSTPGIVVTGSRIQRQDFEANSPIVTVDEEFFQQSTTAAIEQQLNKLPQFVVSQSSTTKNNEGTLTRAGGDIQPNATNTPGAATVSLRGVGSNRTLVLIDGRRGTPSNASGTVDISTIPSAALERVEIISGGASATYGADAVAGVTNFILKKNFQGLELDGQLGLSQWGDAAEYQVSGIVGSDFEDGRGNVSLAMSYNKREAAYERDRPWYRDLWYNNPDTTSGSQFFIARPGVTLQALQPNEADLFNPTACGATARGCVLTDYFAGANPAVPNNTTAIYVNPDGTLFTPSGFAARGGGAAFLVPWNDEDRWKTTSAGTLAYLNTTNYLTVPMTRYNVLARGNYEINDWIGVFGNGMFSHTTTRTTQEPSPITSGWGIQIPWGDGVYTGNDAVPSSVLADGTTNPLFQSMFPHLNCDGYTRGTGGCTNREAFQQVIPQDLQTILDARPDPNAPINLQGMLPNNRETFSDVTTYSLVAGLEGVIPDSDWTWEAFASHGVSTTISRQTGVYSLARTRAVFGAPNFGQGFSFTGNEQDNGFGAVTGTCTTGLNFFGNYGGISQDCREAIAADLNTKSQMKQTVFEANAQGGVLELPAGQLRAAVGASWRQFDYEFINDNLSSVGRSFFDQAIGIYPSGNTTGEIDVAEVYGELLIPILSDLPGIRQLNLEVGGRISNYNTTGTSYTYKILGDWEVTDWLRFRGGFNRAERAPNIAELYLARQQTFGMDTVGDLCSTLLQHPSSANPNTNPTGAADVQAACLALMARDNDGVYVSPDDNASFYGPTWGVWQPTGPGFTFGTVTGNTIFRDEINAGVPALKPEVADTWTAGVVIRSPFDSPAFSRLQLAIDYFNIRIEDPIGPLSVGAMQQLCLDPTYNPAINGAAANQAAAEAAIQNAACQAVARNPSNGGFNTGALNSAAMITTYRNDGLIKLSGIDAQLSWGMDVGPGSLFASVNGNYMIDFAVKELDPNPLVDYVGTLGTGAKGLNFGSSFEYRIFATVGYSYEGASVSLQWNHMPATEDSGEALYLNGLADEGTDDSGIPAYNLFNLNASYDLNSNVRLRFGVDNLFNKRPPITGVDMDLSNNPEGSLPGGGFSFFHDTQGRRFSIGANLKF